MEKVKLKITWNWNSIVQTLVHYSHFKVYFGAWFKWVATVLHRSMMAHSKVRIQRYVSLKKLSLVISHYKSNARMLFVQVRTERSFEFYQIMLLNIEYDMSLSRPHSKNNASCCCNHLLKAFLSFPVFLFFVKLCMWSFSWNLIPFTNMPKVHITHTTVMEIKNADWLCNYWSASYTNKKYIVWNLHNVMIE